MKKSLIAILFCLPLVSFTHTQFDASVTLFEADVTGNLVTLHTIADATDPHVFRFTWNGYEKARQNRHGKIIGWDEPLFFNDVIRDESQHVEWTSSKELLPGIYHVWAVLTTNSSLTIKSNYITIVIQ